MTTRCVLQGKTTMQTYWLVGRGDYHKPLPDFRALSAEDSPPPRLLGPAPGKTGSSSTLTVGDTPDSRKTSVNDIAMNIDDVPSA